MEEEEEQLDTGNKGRATMTVNCAITKDGGLGKSRGGWVLEKPNRQVKVTGVSRREQG